MKLSLSLLESVTLTLLGVGLAFLSMESSALPAFQKLRMTHIYAPSFTRAIPNMKAVRISLSHEISDLNMKIQSEGNLAKFETYQELFLADLDKSQGTHMCEALSNLHRTFSNVRFVLIMIDGVLTNYQSPVKACDSKIVLVDPAATGTQKVAETLEQLYKH